MPSINLLDPSLGIQTIMESPAATRGGILQCPARGRA